MISFAINFKSIIEPATAGEDGDEALASSTTNLKI